MWGWGGYACACLKGFISAISLIVTMYVLQTYSLGGASVCVFFGVEETKTALRLKFISAIYNVQEPISTVQRQRVISFIPIH